MERKVQHAIERDKHLLAALPADDGGPRRRELRMARSRLPSDKVRERTREEHQRRRDERRRHSVRQRLYRPR
jgi:hypothetical protein